MPQRNIKLAYFLTICRFSWFWLGIWVFYYLKFTNYAGIGILETIMIGVMTLAEIPTGAVADIFGKKYTLFISFLLQFIGLIILSTAINFSFMAIGLFIAAIGTAFYSGTLDALIYDSLKEKGEEKQYIKIASRMRAISWITPAICGAIGGFMYAVNPRLPFIAHGFAYLIAIFISFFLKEPKIDTITFSFENYIFQTKQGFKQLFLTDEIKKQTIILLSVGVIIVILDEMLNSFLAVEFGFKEQILGVFWGAVYLISALSAQKSIFFRDKIGNNKSLIFIGAIIAITLVATPVLGIIAGGATILIRSCSQSIYDVLASSSINDATCSKFRATTISTFNMIKNLPYVMLAIFFGILVDSYSAKNIAFVLGVALMLLLWSVKNEMSHFSKFSL